MAMIKAKVLIDFYDKEAKKNRKKGEVIDITPVRFNEITRKGRYIEVCEETATAETKKK